MNAPFVTVTAPPSKSLSHRALIAAGLANGVSVVRNVLRSVDLAITRGCLEAGGVEITELDGGGLRVTGRPGGLTGGELRDGAAPVLLEVHESGTTCRLITAVAAAGHGVFEVRGAPRMHERPIGSLAQALHSLGAEVQWLEKEGYPPLRVLTAGLTGGLASVSLEESSQYLSGLLLAAPLAHKPTVLEIGGSKVVSWPYVSLTLQVMEDFGVQFHVMKLAEKGVRGREPKFLPVPWREIEEARPGELRLAVQPASYWPREYSVEGDWSSASYFLAAGAIGPAVAVAGLRPDSAQGDRAMCDILAAMGAPVSVEDGLIVSRPPAQGTLHGAELDMGRCPDLVPTVAALAAFAQGETVIRNVAHLRIKESDRLAAAAANLERAGASAELLEDGIRIIPPKEGRAGFASGAVDFGSYGDHRMAMSASIYGLAGIDVRLDDTSCVSKSFPDFFTRWAPVLAAAGSRRAGA
ncbi:3-phosphoshikimate 1-carboxyvinyltransferase [Desulfovibrio sp. X2]|uniref:3-phosphoshikimate 1-carboxyvinyltransferase n=1 Tax=Desulfovibrio sp. X2 TaxID=941449 RepID=UPI000358860F|nr:3-phosphoshikimate 1-carboxyvinyltransferase [Desulfovibrio sp. X2]EPR36310.1 3-phosphoshikimate 1-carboxyvinyltransferase [Desulfovibrio sp. X2]